MKKSVDAFRPCSVLIHRANHSPRDQGSLELGLSPLNLAHGKPKARSNSFLQSQTHGHFDD